MNLSIFDNLIIVIITIFIFFNIYSVIYYIIRIKQNYKDKPATANYLNYLNTSISLFIAIMLFFYEFFKNKDAFYIAYCISLILLYILALFISLIYIFISYLVISNTTKIVRAIGKIIEYIKTIFNKN